MSKGKPTQELMRKVVGDVARVASDVQKDVLQASGIELDIARAGGLVALQDALTDDAMACVMALQGSPIGFKTDKDRASGYPMPVVRTAMIQAAMSGARPTGNEFNIIGGNCYLTQEFFWRALKEYPGLSDLVVDMDVPETGKAIGDRGNHIVYCGGFAGCKVNGKAVQVIRRVTEHGDQRFAVSAYAGDIDQAQGKARKRLLQTLFQRVSGVTITDASDDAERVPAIVDASTDDSIEECRKLFGDMSKTTKTLANRIRLATEDGTGDIAGVDAVMSEANGLHSMGKLTDDELDALSNYTLSRLGLPA